jgi:putative hydrolase
VPPGTNRAAVELNDVDVLAHPGFVTTEEAELAKAHDVILELSARALHMVTNGHVARTALEVGNDLVVDSDAHATDQLVTAHHAREVARGAGVPESSVTRVLRETPQRLLKRCGKD